MTRHRVDLAPTRRALTGLSSPPLDRERQDNPDREALERLMTSFWNGRSPHTLAAYKSDIEQFCAYLRRACALEPKTPEIETLGLFFSCSAGRANQLVLDYRSDMKAVDKAPLTINRRLAAIRSLVKLARMTGYGYWSIEVEGVPAELTRDTRGPSPEIVAKLIAIAERQTDPRIATRDVAILWMTFGLGLRVGEVCRLDVADLELTSDAASVWVLGKGRRRKVLLTLPPQTVTAIRAWLGRRGKQTGPLFLSFSNNRRHLDGRLTTRGVYRIMRNLGARIGVHLHPHMLRHSAVTQAVEQSVELGLSLDRVMDFSRHKNVATLMTYRDRIDNKQADLARAVARTTDPIPQE